MPSLHRRKLLQAGVAGAGLLLATPRLLLAATGGERRFVFIIQRGAADGLNTVIPYAEPSYANLRGPLAIDPGAAIKLDGSFALHPSLAAVGRLYAAREALFVHAVASPYRDRSHFDGQNVLETGGALPYQLKDGWLNRLVALMGRPGKEAMAFAPTVPVALRGSAEVISYAASALPQAQDDLLSRVEQLYARDPQLHAVWSAAMQARGMAGPGMGDGGNRQDPAVLGKLAARFLAQLQGARIAMIETGGWDTHSAQHGRLATQLRNLDTLLATLKEGLGTAWGQTVVLVATEFGRTAAANGTGGTDHGTGSVALLLGGAVQGGRIVADWPGLAPGALFEGRDLRPTLSLDALITAAIGECFGLERERVARSLFPHAAAFEQMPVLLRSA